MELKKALELVSTGKYKNLSAYELLTLEGVLAGATGLDASEALKSVKIHLNETNASQAEVGNIVNPFMNNPNAFREDIGNRYNLATKLLEDNPAAKGQYYHVNDLLDQLAEQTTAMQMAISEEELTKESLDAFREKERNRIAVEYYASVLGVSGKEPNFKSKETLAKTFLEITNMVENKKSKLDIYKRFKINPTADQEAQATATVVVTNTGMLKSWLNKAKQMGRDLGQAGAKALDACLNFERNNPAVSMAMALATSLNPATAIAYSAYRMGLAARSFTKDYSDFKAKNPKASAWAIIKDKKMRQSFMSSAVTFGRSLPGLAQGYAIYNMCKKDFWKGLAQNAKQTKAAVTELYNTGGKEGWKKLYSAGGALAAAVAGAALLSSCSGNLIDEINNDLSGGETGPDNAADSTRTANVKKLNLFGGQDSTAVITPVTDSTAVITPVADSTAVITPVADSTAVITPVADSTAVITPVADSTEVTTPIDTTVMENTAEDVLKNQWMASEEGQAKLAKMEQSVAAYNAANGTNINVYDMARDGFATHYTPTDATTCATSEISNPLTEGTISTVEQQYRNLVSKSYLMQEVSNYTQEDYVAMRTFLETGEATPESINAHIKLQEANVLSEQGHWTQDLKFSQDANGNMVLDPQGTNHINSQGWTINNATLTSDNDVVLSSTAEQRHSTSYVNPTAPAPAPVTPNVVIDPSPAYTILKETEINHKPIDTTVVFDEEATEIKYKPNHYETSADEISRHGLTPADESFNETIFSEIAAGSGETTTHHENQSEAISDQGLNPKNESLGENLFSDIADAGGSEKLNKEILNYIEAQDDNTETQSSKEVRLENKVNTLAEKLGLSKEQLQARIDEVKEVYNQAQEDGAKINRRNIHSMWQASRSR